MECRPPSTRLADPATERADALAPSHLCTYLESIAIAGNTDQKDWSKENGQQNFLTRSAKVNQKALDPHCLSQRWRSWGNENKAGIFQLKDQWSLSQKADARTVKKRKGIVSEEMGALCLASGLAHPCFFLLLQRCFRDLTCK